MLLDNSDFKRINCSGTENVEMYMGDNLNWKETSASIFTAEFKYGLTVKVVAHEDIKSEKAFEYAKLFAEVLGRVPSLLRQNLENLHLIHGNFNPTYGKCAFQTIGNEGDDACGAGGHFKVGTLTLCVEEGLTKIEDGTCEELFFHECTHVTVDPIILTVRRSTYLYYTKYCVFC